VSQKPFQRGGGTGGAHRRCVYDHNQLTEAKTMQLVEQALAHIASIHPSVTQVVYDDELRWCYSDGKGVAVAFRKSENITLLEQAADEAFERGLQNVPVHLTVRGMQELCNLWNDLADVVTNDGCIDDAFVHFEAGTAVEDIWHWFEEQNPAFTAAGAGNRINKDHPFRSLA
jgi:hypothetical protein